MKHFLPFSMLLAGAAFSNNAFAQDGGNQGIVPSQEHPNIILFLVDDMGWQETSVPFWNEETALPHSEYGENGATGCQIHAGLRLCHLITFTMQSDVWNECGPSSRDELDTEL